MGDPSICEPSDSEPSEATARVPSDRVVSDRVLVYLERSDDELSVAVSQLSALLAATHAELLDVIAAIDTKAAWIDDGATAMAPWLTGRCGIGRATANEWVRVADALQDLPALRQCYASGAMSWDQIRHATRFASSVDDTDLAARLPGLSANQIATLARQCRPIPDTDAATAHAARSLTWRRDHRRGGYSYRGFVPFDQGDAINTALDRHAERAGPNADTGAWDPISTRRADALHDLATRALGADPDPDRATVVIHADAKVIDGQVAGNGFLRDVAICQTTLLRSLCDARVEVALHGPDGATVGIARASQHIPHWLRRHIGLRDHTCRFPGCERQIRQIHHIDHWTNGGPTNADNLCGLCWYHHHLVHEGGWTIEGNPTGELTFINPTNIRRLTSSPQPLHRHTRRRTDTLR
jgi:hypothetical protein